MQHLFNSDGERGLVITAKANLILFKTEIEKADVRIKNEVMLTYRYQALQGLYKQKEVENEFLPNIPYLCEIVMANVTPKHKRVNLLYCVPNGSIPLLRTRHTGSYEF